MLTTETQRHREKYELQTLCALGASVVPPAIGFDRFPLSRE